MPGRPSAGRTSSRPSCQLFVRLDVDLAHLLARVRTFATASSCIGPDMSCMQFLACSRSTRGRRRPRCACSRRRSRRVRHPRRSAATRQRAARGPWARSGAPRRSGRRPQSTSYAGRGRAGAEERRLHLDLDAAFRDAGARLLHGRQESPRVRGARGRPHGIEFRPRPCGGARGSAGRPDAPLSAVSPVNPLRCAQPSTATGLPLRFCQPRAAGRARSSPGRTWPPCQTSSSSDRARTKQRPAFARVERQHVARLRLRLPGSGGPGGRGTHGG